MAFDPTLRYRFVFEFDLNYLDKAEDANAPLTKMLIQFIDMDAKEHLRLLSYDQGEHMIEVNSDKFEGVRDDLESDYGIHDFSTIGDAEVFGYTSYEVASDKVDELMEHWRNFFVNEGFAVGPVLRMTGEEYARDWPYDS